MIKNMPTQFEMNVSWCATISIKIFDLFVDLPQTHGPYHRGGEGGAQWDKGHSRLFWFIQKVENVEL